MPRPAAWAVVATLTDRTTPTLTALTPLLTAAGVHLRGGGGSDNLSGGVGNDYLIAATERFPGKRKTQL